MNHKPSEMYFVPRFKLNCCEIVWWSLLTNQIRGAEFVRGAAGLQIAGSPASSALPSCTLKTSHYCINVFLLCSLTIVQFGRETLPCVSSIRRRCVGTIDLILKYKCTFSELFSYLLGHFPFKAENYIHFVFPHACHKL